MSSVGYLGTLWRHILFLKDPRPIFELFHFDIFIVCNICWWWWRWGGLLIAIWHSLNTELIFPIVRVLSNGNMIYSDVRQYARLVAEKRHGSIMIMPLEHGTYIHITLPIIFCLLHHSPHQKKSISVGVFFQHIWQITFSMLPRDYRSFIWLRLWVRGQITCCHTSTPPRKENLH